MKKLFARLCIALIASLVLVSSLTATPVYAAVENWVDGDYPTCFEYATDPNGQQGVCKGGYVSSTQGDTMSDIVRRSLGPIKGVTATVDVWQRNPQYAQHMLQGSAVAGISNYIAMMYTNPPADLAFWIRDTGQTLGFIPKIANAQGPGIGFSGLAPLLKIWKIFRNIAYLLLAIVMIVIGFMVMFRKKIDPKTVVTVQNALPKIVMTLILITFSYAIVGIMIDIMYLSIVLVMALFGQAGLIKTTPESVQDFMSAPLFGTSYWLLFPQGPLSMLKLIVQILGGWVTGATAGLSAGAGILLLGASALGSMPLLPLVAFGAAGGVIGISLLAVFILTIIILFAYIRLFFSLFSCYLQVIIGLIFGPVLILMDAFPGSNAFSNWLVGLVGNLLAFPIAAILILLAAAFAGIVLPLGGSSQIWAPPLLMGSSASSDTIFGLLSLGIIFLIPQLINSTKEALKAKATVPVGSAFGQAFTSPISTGMQAISTLYYIKQLRAPSATPAEPKRKEDSRSANPITGG